MDSVCCCLQTVEGWTPNKVIKAEGMALHRLAALILTDRGTIMTWRPHLDKLAFLTALLAVYTGEILQASPLPLMVNDTATARNMLITSQLNKIVSYFIIANFSENPFAVYNLFQEINLGRIFRRQYKGAVAFSSVPRLSSPRWRCVWPWLFFSFFFPLAFA